MEQTADSKKSIKTFITALTGLLILTAFTFIFWQNIAAGAKSFAYNALTGQIKNHMGGEVSFEEISFIPAGEVTLTNVSVRDGTGALLAHSPIMRVYYNWRWTNFDIKKFNLRELAFIERIYLQRCEIFIREKNNRMELIPLLKTPKGDGDFFRGQVQLGAARINLIPAWDYNNIIVNEVNGEIDFKNPKDIIINLTGKLDKTPLAVNGNYSKENGELTLQSNMPVDLTGINFKNIFPAFSDIHLKEGFLESIVLAIQKTSGDNWKIKANGEFSDLNVVEAVEISRAGGSFTLDNARVNFDDLSFAFKDLQIAGTGNILWNSADLSDTDINFSFFMPLVDPLLISSRLEGQQPIVVDILVAGSLKNPAISGKFSTSRLNLEDIYVSNIIGKFRYAGDYRAILYDVQGESLGGIITANGDLFFDNQTCEINIVGNGLDSFLVLGKDIQGKLDFNAHMSNRSENTITKGNFVIREGHAFGTPFQVFNGFFVKQNGQSDVSDIAVRTALGNFYSDNKEALSTSIVISNNE